MTISVTPMGPDELQRIRILPDTGFGVLRTDRGNLPLDRLDVRATISGLVARTAVVTEFVNNHDVALEATYVFPLPDRAAVTAMRMTADDRTVEAELRERAAAREAYDRAIAAGQRASIAEEDRPDVFTMRVGNIRPGERVTVELNLVGPLPFEDGAATFRFPLVVAPRYIPGTPLPGPQAGDGRQLDTDAVPDASRISPPVLLPGFPNPLRLSIDVEIDPAGLVLGEVRSSLHTVTRDDATVRIQPGERADRDFVLRLAYGGDTQTAIAVPDNRTGEGGVYQVIVVPPADPGATRPKDVVLLLDRSGSMGGWKMVAARRAAARIVDTLTAEDRFAVLTFDHEVDRPATLGSGLSEASDRNRFRAVEHLSQAQARGGTELLEPLVRGLDLLRASEGRDRVLVLVTDGQVGNEDQIVQTIAGAIGSTRIHTVGIDRAVNAGFLGRLAAIGAGRAELVESEDRLDAAMEHIHRRIGSPLVTDVQITAAGLRPLDDERSPARLPGIYPGVPLVVMGRYAGRADGALTVTGRTRDDQEFTATIPVRERSESAILAHWARARLRDLEDAYAAGAHHLEQQIVSTSLRYGVLCRFTAFVAVDSRVVNKGGTTRRVTQPVELPSGWEAPGTEPPQIVLASGVSPASAPPPMAPQPAPPGRFSPVHAEAAGPRRPRSPMGFATVPSALRAGKGVVRAGAAPPLDDIRRVAGVEAQRLREGATLPGYERRQLLDDLASRLRVLLSELTGPEFTALHELVAMLDGDGSLDDRWASALQTLATFANAEEPHSREATKDPGRKQGAIDSPGERNAEQGTGEAAVNPRREEGTEGSTTGMGGNRGGGGRSDPHGRATEDDTAPRRRPFWKR